MKVAVVHMPTVLADLEANLKTAETYIAEASLNQVELIVFPEFFTTGFAVTPKLVEAIRMSCDMRKQMKKWSSNYHIAIGGSYLYPDRKAGEVYNEFGLYFPDGICYTHSKDIPTALESFCYTKGDSFSAFDTPLGRIGIVMCWEQIRYQTVKRMAGKVDLLVGGSCWWNFAPEDGDEIYKPFYQWNQNTAKKAPQILANIFGVPYIHASHTAKFAGMNLMGTKTCTRKIESSAVIVNANGEILAEQKSAGWLSMAIEPKRGRDKIAIPENQFWIPQMPAALEKGFFMLNERWGKVYQEKTKPAVFGR